MTATDELRRLLDERGVEWQSKPELIIGGIEKGTEFDAADGRLVRAVEALDGTICLSHLTPEQAIAATLGAGTCEVDATIKWDWDRCEPYWEHELSCGHTVTTMEPEPPHFCPNCGRRIVDPTTNDVDAEVDE